MVTLCVLVGLTVADRYVGSLVGIEDAGLLPVIYHFRSRCDCIACWLVQWRAYQADVHVKVFMNCVADTTEVSLEIRGASVCINVYEASPTPIAELSLDAMELRAG
jgi:hypothetical protein